MKPQERLLMISTLIVVASALFLIVVSVLGVGINNNSSKNNEQFPNMGLPIISEPNILEDDGLEISILEESSSELSFSVSKNNDVLVAECACDYCIDTEPGFMIAIYDIPDTLPLCITEEYLDSNLGITVYSYGGYHPDESGLNALLINQPKTGLGGCVEIDWIYVGSFVCDNPDMACYGCLVDVWVADFVLDEPIQIDSNHLPDLYTYGADWSTICDGQDNLNKWVYLCMVTSWEGCDEPDQKFQLILAHKNSFSEIPSSV
ncbi:MAG: hypothetical protein ACFFDH_02135 [Promethearchaeota archaeon]